ncbi:hypothetical protein [Bacillus sp. MMSF_3328]|uniref:hypothetical protein n=1 Tax=Bacillus sp. MMSF_3328 TaxID=3047080 RepID=UPI00273D4569|nr:hypothetical protein [Bacillus sp. MMSF_3328]
MIYVKVDGDAPNGYAFIHYLPFDKDQGLGKSREELEEEGGVFLDAVPNSQTPADKVAIMKYSPEQGLYYEYMDRPLSPDDKILQIEEQLGTMLFESATDKARIAELEASQGDLLMEIATMKMGGDR